MSQRKLHVVRSDTPPDKAREEAKAVDEYLANTDDDIIACRGFGHPWPQLRRPPRGRRSAPVPKGIRVTPPVEGMQQIEATCPSCGKVRIMTIEKGTALEDIFPAKYVYDDSNCPGYKAPKGVRIPRRIAAAESYRRMLTGA